MSFEQNTLQSLDPQLEKQRYMSCKVLEDNMELPAKEIFQKIINDEEVKQYIQEENKLWFMERKELFGKELPVDLVTILYFCMNSLLLQYGEDASAALKANKLTIKNRRYYALSNIVKEYKGTAAKKNPLYMHHQADAYFELLSIDSSIVPPYKTKEEYIDFLYASICEWGKDSERYLCEFKFFNKYKPEKKVDYLFLDISGFILNYIVYKNAGNFDVTLLSFPSSLTERGVFGFKNQYYDTQVSIEKNGKIQNAIPYNFEENGNIRLNRTIINEVDVDMDDIELCTEPSKELIEILINKHGFVENTRDLSNFSFHVVGSVYSLLNPTNLSQEWIHFEDGKAFVRSILQKSKITKRDCIKVRNELLKLRNAKMETKKVDSSGKILEEAYYSFFDIKFTYGQEVQDEEYYKETSFTDTNEMLDEDPMADYDFIGNDWSISIAPSSYLKDEWKNKKNTDIYSKLYKISVSNKVSEVVTIMFQQLRIDNLESLATSIDYSYLRNRLKGNGIKLSIFKKELEKELSMLKNSSVIIKDYEFFKNYLYVEFLPLSEIEIEVYGFRKSILEHLD